MIVSVEMHHQSEFHVNIYFIVTPFDIRELNMKLTPFSFYNGAHTTKERNKKNDKYVLFKP